MRTEVATKAYKERENLLVIQLNNNEINIILHNGEAVGSRIMLNKACSHVCPSGNRKGIIITVNCIRSNWRNCNFLS